MVWGGTLVNPAVELFDADQRRVISGNQQKLGVPHVLLDGGEHSWGVGCREHQRLQQKRHFAFFVINL